MVSLRSNAEKTKSARANPLLNPSLGPLPESLYSPTIVLSINLLFIGPTTAISGGSLKATMPRDEFAEIARHLQEAVSELQETLNHEKRLTLLGHMRLLLLEADRVLDEGPLKPLSPMA
jgi:hypothetical protein